MVDLALHLLEEHLPDAWHEIELRRADKRDIIEQGREVTARGEVGRSADAERGIENDASHDVTDRHEAQGDRGQLAVRIQAGVNQPRQQLAIRRSVYIAPFGVPVEPEV